MRFEQCKWKLVWILEALDISQWVSRVPHEAKCNQEGKGNY